MFPQLLFFIPNFTLVLSDILISSPFGICTLIPIFCLTIHFLIKIIITINVIWSKWWSRRSLILNFFIFKLLHLSSTNLVQIIMWLHLSAIHLRFCWNYHFICYTSTWTRWIRSRTEEEILNISLLEFTLFIKTHCLLN